MTASLNRPERVQAGLALLAIIAASWILWRQFQRQRITEPMSYFYDLSQGALFVAPKASVPPIRGMDDDTEDGVRAVVIAKDGDCSNPAGRSIAYLEMYSPELKAQFESFRSDDISGPPSIRVLSRSEAKAHHFVRLPEEDRWHPINSRRGQEITESWRSLDNAGIMPAVCVP